LKVGVRAHDFGRQTAAELAHNVKNAGFDCVQLAPTKAIADIQHFDDISDLHLDIIGKEFARNELEISILGCYVEPSLLDDQKRLENVRYFTDGIVNAKKLGVNIIGTETTNLAIDTPSSHRETVYQKLVDSVKRMVDVAEKHDILVGIEPVAEHTLNTPTLARRLLDTIGSDKLKIIFDPVNLVLPTTIHQQQAIFNETFQLLGEQIVVVHLKDIVIEDNQKVWRKIGDGVIDYKLIFDWLHANKPNIPLLREGVSMDSYRNDRETIFNFATRNKM